MRKLILLTLASAIMIGNTTNITYAQQQNNGNTKTVTLTATIPQDDDEDGGIVAYSDTTSASDTTSYQGQTHISIGPNGISFNGFDDMEDLDIGGKWLLDILSGTAGVGTMIFAIFILLLVFLFLCAPIIIIALIIWYLVRRNNKRAEIANKAMESGQPMPQETVPEERQTDDYLWRKGIRNAFLGLGLVIADYFMGTTILSAIGAIIACMGIGQAVIAKTSGKNKKQGEDQN